MDARRDIEKSSNTSRWNKFFWIGAVAVVSCLAIALIVYFSVGNQDEFSHSRNEEANNNHLGQYKSRSRRGEYKQAAVSTDSAPCAEIGRKILEKNGSAADSIIAVLLCMGVTIPQSMGLGGGCLITFYNSTSKSASVIDARETAPAKATEDMYGGNTTLPKSGPLALAVPGELAGYYHLHKKHGKLWWHELFEGAIGLARNGFPVGAHLAMALSLNEKMLRKHKAMSDVYINKQTNKPYQEGEIFKNEKLAQTLELLANSSNPRETFYNKIASLLLNDVKAQLSEWDSEPIIDLDDFKNYRVQTARMVVTAKFKRGNLTLHSFPLPGTGHILAFVMKLMEKFDEYPKANQSYEGAANFWHRLMEAYKFAYSKRMSLGDNAKEFDEIDKTIRATNETLKQLLSEDFINKIHSLIYKNQTFGPDYYNVSYIQPFDHGTAHASVVDKFGNGAAVTPTVNLFLGSKIFSPSTGILLNDEMDDFSLPNITNAFGVPPSPHNRIRPGKRPLSSMVPTIFSDQDGNVRLIIGASGGTKITTSTALVAIRHLWFGEDIKEAIDAPRLHHQLYPNEVVYEKGFPQELVALLKAKKHKIRQLGENERPAIVMAIANDRQNYIANADYRKGGDVAGF